MSGKEEAGLQAHARLDRTCPTVNISGYYNMYVCVRVCARMSAYSDRVSDKKREEE